MLCDYGIACCGVMGWRVYKLNSSLYKRALESDLPMKGGLCDSGIACRGVTGGRVSMLNKSLWDWESGLQRDGCRLMMDCMLWSHGRASVSLFNNSRCDWESGLPRGRLNKLDTQTLEYWEFGT